MAQITMYVTNYCPYCTAAKRLLERKKLQYETIDVSNDPEKRAWLVETSGQRTVPQIFIHGKPYGGYQEIEKLERAGELDAILAASP